MTRADKLNGLRELIQLDRRPDEAEADRHTWAVVGEAGAVHIWAQMLPEAINNERLWPRGFYGGIEVHRSTPAEWDDPDTPSHEHCWLLGGPCWHDGSSLHFEERVAPEISALGPDKAADFCLSVARNYYKDVFEADQ